MTTRGKSSGRVAQARKKKSEGELEARAIEADPAEADLPRLQPDNDSLLRIGIDPRLSLGCRSRRADRNLGGKK